MHGWQQRELEEAPTPVPASWQFGPADVAIAGVALALSLAVCAPVAWHFRAEAQRLDREVQGSIQRCRQLGTAVERSQTKRAGVAELRREVNRYVAEVEARPIVPWTTVVSEISQRRPGGLWATRISGNGPHFRAQILAEDPELVSAYTQRLRESPYVDFAALPAGATPGPRVQVVGRMRGD